MFLFLIFHRGVCVFLWGNESYKETIYSVYCQMQIYWLTYMKPRNSDDLFPSRTGCEHNQYRQQRDVASFRYQVTCYTHTPAAITAVCNEIKLEIFIYRSLPALHPSRRWGLICYYIMYLYSQKYIDTETQ